MATVELTADATRDGTSLEDNRPWRVAAAAYQDGGDGVITPRWSDPIFPVAGKLTIPVEAGIAAVIENPDKTRYTVTAPVVDTPLWEVIEAGVAYPPETSQEALGAAVGQYVLDHADDLVEAADIPGSVLSTATGRAIAFAIALG